MKELISNFSHGSEISVLRNRDNFTKKIKSIIKIARTKSGMNYINKEKDGWEWYANRDSNLKKIILNFENKEDINYSKIELKYVSGIKADYKKGLRRNKKNLLDIVRYYLKIWDCNTLKTFPIHGDFSLDNIVFSKENIIIVDWEHFTFDNFPWGFDILYLICESLWFNIKANKLPIKSDILFMVILLKLLKKNGCLKKEQIYEPFCWTKNFIINNSQIWGSQFNLFPQKFPVILFTDKQISFIDKQIQTYLDK